MKTDTPHIVQYQGSKRLLAPQILGYMPKRFPRLIEPFAGMAAITIATAKDNRADNYLINDINTPVVELLKSAIEQPEELIRKYYTIWRDQFGEEMDHLEHFYEIRERFNNGQETPEYMLYLLARCVKGAVRYSKNGKFNQSPDKRRHGTNPSNIAKNVRRISSMLKGKIIFSAVDYREVLNRAEPGDLVYMDPPYQGVTNTRDNRYYSGVEFQEFAKAIERLNERNIDYLISYDGECGGRSYGTDLPPSLGCCKILLNAGLSTQSTLLGKRDTTYEALYLSPALSSTVQQIPSFYVPKQLDLLEATV